MRLAFERRGGFAGTRLRAEVDTADLSTGERERVEGWLRDAGFYALPARLAGAAPDRFVYRLSADGPEGAHAVEADEAALPPALEPLVEWLTGRARRG